MMSLFRRNRRAREETAGPGADTVAEPDVQVTHEHDAGHPAPAELDALVGEAPSTRRRGRLRRRLRHLRRVREVLLRDLGGLTFELHRSGADGASPVLDGKLTRLAMVDAEIRELAERLDDHRAMVIREPGIGGTCAECGELFGSEARYCWACGNPVAPGQGGAPHLAAWTTHPQLTGASAPAEAVPLAAPSVEGTWVEHPTQPLASQDQPTTEHAPEPPSPAPAAPDPVPQMDPEQAAAAAEPPAPNEPATGDVGGEEGAAWSEPEPEPRSWLPQADRDDAPPLSSGDPLAPRKP